MTAQKITIQISGMDCSNCAESIAAMLRRKGMVDAQVNFTTGEAIFTPTSNYSASEIRKAIMAMGYKVTDETGSESTEFLTAEKKLIISAVFTFPLLLHMIPGLHFFQQPLLQFFLSLPVIFIGVFHFGRSAWNSLKNLFPNMDVLIFTGFMSAFVYSVIGTFFIPAGETPHHYLFYETSASIITLVLLGNYIEHKAVKQATSAVESLNKIKPLTARIVIRIGDKEKYILSEIKHIKQGDIVLVNSGERFPADGEVLEGSGFVDQSMFTGESEPVLLDQGKKVIGGSVLSDGNIKISVIGAGENSYLHQMIDMVKKAAFNKPRIQQLGDRVSAIFVPVVLFISLTTYFTGHFWFQLDNFHAVMNAVAVLVISCPCAMGLATPTAVMVGIGRSARQGIIIKGGNTIQALAEARHFLFDKTGTLTTGKFRVLKIDIHDTRYSEDKIRGLIYAMESHSNHPIAKSLTTELKLFAGEKLEAVEEIKGIGIKAKIGGDVFQLGSARVLTDLSRRDDAQVFLMCNNTCIASVYLQDELRPGASVLMNYLQKAKINVAMISGDVRDKCNVVAEKIQMKTVFASMLPHEKLNKIQETGKNGPVVMVGDGINDAPSLSAANIGISFSSASDIAVQSSDIILLEGSLEKIQEARELAVATLSTIKQNLFWAFCYNVVAIPLAAMGYLNPMWGAAFMAFSDLMVIGNSIRLNFRKIFVVKK